MSFIPQPAPVARPNRCQLFGPGSRPALFTKMASSEADVLNLDLEDSVAPADKVQARANIVEALQTIDFANKTVSVRINGLDTQYWVRDVVDLIEQAGERLDLIMIPKVGRAADIYAVDAMVSALEAQVGRKKPLGLEIIIETAAGLANINEIAAGSPRLQAVSFGPADYAASMGMATTAIGGTQSGYYMLPDAVPAAGHDGSGDGAAAPRYPQFADPWHMVSTAIVAACRAHGVLPVDGPFGDFSDAEGYKAQALRSATLGMVGKWAIHPSQIALANEVFTPSDAAVTRARRIMDAMDEAQRSGAGAVTLDGKLIDIASIRQAEVIVKQAELIAAG
ncbi:MAG: CoA ester lyase [Pseudomonadota bacterium]